MRVLRQRKRGCGGEGGVGEGEGRRGLWVRQMRGGWLTWRGLLVGSNCSRLTGSGDVVCGARREGGRKALEGHA